MNRDVERYRERREERLRERNGRDPVSEYRDRRLERLESRFDANPRVAYGIARGMGIDTTGMSPKEVWEAIRKEDPGMAKKERGSMKTATTVSGSGLRKNAAGFVGGWKPPKVAGMDHATVRKTLSKCNRIGGNHYDKATEVANAPNRPFLWTFTTHGMDHVQQVLDKTNQAADEIEKLSPTDDFRPSKIDRKTMLVAAWFHDTGMDGGDKDWGDDTGDGVRSAHGTNSALHILEHAREIEKLGVNPSQAAFIAFAHTKSKSKIHDLMNPSHWQMGVEKIQEAVREYNATHKGKEIEFKPEDVFEGGKPTKENISHMASQVAALRLGDANREANIPLRSQSGGEYKIEKQAKPEECSGWDAEVDGSTISITDGDGRHELSADDPKMSKVSGFRISKGTVLGERNMVKVDTKASPDGKALREEITLRGGNDVPWCTARAIFERCGEMNTINGVPREVVIHMGSVKNKSGISEHAKSAYDDMWEDVKRIGETNNDGNMSNRNRLGVTKLTLRFEDGSTIEYERK